MKILLGIVALLALLAGVAFLIRINFLGSLGKHAEKIEASPAVTSDDEEPLPPLVKTYLDRVGVEAGASYSHSFFEQTGKMKLSPDGDWVSFTAEQWMAVDRSAFFWQPTMAMPMGSVIGTDRLDGDAQLEMRVFGVVPVAKDTSDGLIEGELARYLAEIPWNPACLVGNEDLQLEQLDDHRVEVTATVRGKSSSVTLKFGEDGLIVGSYTDERPRDSSPDAARQPWGGDFFDYRDFDGIQVPTRAEVYWDLPDGKYTYFKGDVVLWEQR